MSVLKKTGTVIELSGEEWQLYMEGAFCRTEGRTGVPGAGIAGWFVCGLFVAKYQSGDEAWNEDDWNASSSNINQTMPGIAALSGSSDSL